MTIIDLIKREFLGKKIIMTECGKKVEGILSDVSWDVDWDYLGLELKFENGEKVFIPCNEEITEKND